MTLSPPQRTNRTDQQNLQFRWNATGHNMDSKSPTSGALKEVPDGEGSAWAAVQTQQPLGSGIHARELELDLLVFCTVRKGIDHLFHIVVHALVDRSVNGDLAVVRSRFQDLQQFRLVQEGNVLVELAS